MGISETRTVAIDVRSAFGELSQALNWCWPGGDDRFVHERNISLYIAHRLRERRFFTYHEAALERKRVTKDARAWGLYTVFYVTKADG